MDKGDLLVWRSDAAVAVMLLVLVSSSNAASAVTVAQVVDNGDLPLEWSRMSAAFDAGPAPSRLPNPLSLSLALPPLLSPLLSSPFPAISFLLFEICLLCRALGLRVASLHASTSCLSLFLGSCRLPQVHTHLANLLDDVTGLVT